MWNEIKNFSLRGVVYQTWRLVKDPDRDNKWPITTVIMGLFFMSLCLDGLSDHWGGQTALSYILKLLPYLITTPFWAGVLMYSVYLARGEAINPIKNLLANIHRISLLTLSFTGVIVFSQWGIQQLHLPFMDWLSLVMDLLFFIMAMLALIYLLDKRTSIVHALLFPLIVIKRYPLKIMVVSFLVIAGIAVVMGLTVKWFALFSSLPAFWFVPDLLIFEVFFAMVFFVHLFPVWFVLIPYLLILLVILAFIWLIPFSVILCGVLYHRLVD